MKYSSPPQRSRAGSPWLATACCVSLLVFSACSGTSRRDANQSLQVPENIVLITIDTLRADHLGCYGDRSARTPNLDALAARGTRFAQAVTAVPLTLPSHASILTGTYPPAHGVRDMGGFVLGALPPTLATVLARAGFRAAAFVGSFSLDHQFGLNQGFETYDDQMPATSDLGTGVHEPERRAEAVVDRALGWLQARPSGRFFLWVHLFDPHTPYEPPEPYRTRFSGRLYDGEIAYTDAQLGRFLEAFRAAELTERTLFAVLGDHGESLGEHGEATHGVFLYDDAVRIPFLVAGPGVPAGKVVDAQVRSIDLAPTILAALGLAPESQMQGASLWPLIKGQANLPAESRFAYLETIYPRTHMGWSELRAVRTAEWKYIQAPQEELYDLRIDPSESRNGLKFNPAVLERYKAVMGSILGASGQGEILKAGQVSDEARQELASLGYVSAGAGHAVKLDQSRPDPKTRIGILREFEAAIDLMSRREYRRAAPLLERLSANDPSNPLLYLRLGICYQLEGDGRNAVRTYQRASQHQTETDEMMYRLGNLLMEQGDFRRAVGAFGRALELNPAHWASLNNLAICNFELGKLPESERAFELLLKQGQGAASAHNGLGLIRLRQRRRAEAAAEFRKALEVDPQFWDAWLNLGIFYVEEGHPQEALRCLGEFARGAPPARYGQSINQAREMIAKLQAGAS